MQKSLIGQIFFSWFVDSNLPVLTPAEQIRPQEEI